jgi:hypothetical protein
MLRAASPARAEDLPLWEAGLGAYALRLPVVDAAGILQQLTHSVIRQEGNALAKPVFHLYIGGVIVRAPPRVAVRPAIGPYFQP